MHSPSDNKATIVPIERPRANRTPGEMVQAMADIYGRYTGGPES